MKFLKNEITKEQYREMSKNLSKILLVKSSSGYLQSLIEILQDQTVQSSLQNTR
jgi:stalled ribosome rescue protein Dom34